MEGEWDMGVLRARGRAKRRVQKTHALYKGGGVPRLRAPGRTCEKGRAEADRRKGRWRNCLRGAKKICKSAPEGSGAVAETSHKGGHVGDGGWVRSGA